jgi:hypothetical protein
MTLAEPANVAVFMASDRASGMTGTNVNLSMGSLDDQESEPRPWDPRSS